MILTCPSCSARFTINTELIGTAGRKVRCGKESCTRCPHGPYWYAYWTEEGRRRSRYIGKLDDIPELDSIP